MPVLVTSKFDEDPNKNEQVSLKTPFSHYKSMGYFLDAQGHLTLKGVVRSGQNSNLFKILSLSSSLTQIGSKLKALAWSFWFHKKKICHSRASNSEVKGLIRPEIELGPDFMPVLVTSKPFSYFSLWEIF